MTEEQIYQVLADIQTSVPQKWRQQLFVTVKKTPTAEFVVKKALKLNSLDPKKREELELLLRSGEFSKTETIINEKMAKRIDKFVERKINNAVKLGKLPTKEELAKLPFYKKYASQETT
jgi:hypothetical protein